MKITLTASANCKAKSLRFEVWVKSASTNVPNSTNPRPVETESNIAKSVTAAVETANDTAHTFQRSYLTISAAIGSVTDSIRKITRARDCNASSTHPIPNKTSVTQ